MARTASRIWKPPADMPKDIIRRVLAKEICGAKKRAGKGYCTARSVDRNSDMPPPRRCRFHGGMSPGAPIGNQRALKHGLYATAVLPHEEEDHLRMLEKPDSIDEEVAITRLRLQRALRAEATQDALNEAHLEKGFVERWKKTLRVTKLVEEHGISKDGSPVATYREERTDVDYARRISSLVNQLVRLLDLRRQIIDGASMTVSEKAALARETLKQMRKSMTDETEPDE